MYDYYRDDLTEVRYGMNEKMEMKIREYTHRLTDSLSDECIRRFLDLSETDLRTYCYGMVLCLCSDLLCRGGELHEYFMENGIKRADLMYYYTVRGWHRELHEHIYNEILAPVLSDEALRGIIMRWWPGASILRNKRELTDFVKTPPSGLSLYHFGLGVYIRNEVLTVDSELHEKFVSAGIDKVDDMSRAMVRVWHNALRKGDIKIE